MNKVVLLILTGAIALLAEGCSFFSNFADSRRNLERETAKPNPTKVDTTTTQAQSEGKEFADLEDAIIEPTVSIAGLIPATNPDTRVRSSVRGRQDPFSTVTLTPLIEIEAREEAKKSVDNSSRSNRNPSSTAVSSNRSENNRKVTPIARAKAASIAASTTAKTTSAEPFKPTLAQEVVISGLYEAGGRTRLIIQAPEESSSRYVEVGQYLSNGKVLVKSVDHKNLSNPKVILEQAGVEVIKTIGENLADSASNLNNKS